MSAEAEIPRSAALDELSVRLQAALGDAYVVERPLGAGGFAAVYLVRDAQLKRKLAVKVLHPDVIATHSALERFQREAEIVAQLTHPNIVPLHFIGRKNDLIYLVMQAVDGGSLADRIEREGPLPIAMAAKTFCEVAGAVAYAHKRGVIHRDIKPHNVLIDSESGRAMLTDFGIARTPDGGTLTLTGTVVGTPAYLSPEQVMGESFDHRADIYALGVVAYEMLAGEPPFTGSTPNAALMRRLAAPHEPLTTRRPDVPPSLAALVDACLAMDASKRLQSADDIVRALTEGSAIRADVAPATSRNALTARRSLRRWALAAGALLAIVFAVFFAASRPKQSAGVPAAPLDPGMVIIPAGVYGIGSDTGPPASRPEHQVRIGAFGIDRREVTIGEYGAYVLARHTPTPWRDAAVADSNLPVTRVTWTEAAAYCAWRHVGGRLPTETEWESAARGKDGRLYPWGNTFDSSAANTGSRRRGPVAVGSYSHGRSPSGLVDMIGNVWEWTSSPFASSYADTARPSATLYVIRGGAYNSYDEVATSIFRGRARADATRADLASTGFRCVMPAPNT